MLETFEFARQELPYLIGTFVFIFGAIVGSFLNVCIYRIPEGKSIVFPGSHCACGAKIQWYDNIPILSWCLLRGRARCCGRKFSFRYPAIELLTGVLFAIAWFQHPPLLALLGAWFLAFLICATFIDLDHMIIPDRFSIGGAVIAVFLSFCFPIIHGVENLPGIANIESGIQSIIGMLVGAGLVYWIATLGEIIFRKPAMGEGDVKFVGFIGAFCGWQGAIFAMFGGAILGTLILIPIMIWKKLRPGPDAPAEETETNAASATESPPSEPEDDAELDYGTGHIPFGPMLAGAAVIYFLGADVWVDAYFQEFITLMTHAAETF